MPDLISSALLSDTVFGVVDFFFLSGHNDHSNEIIYRIKCTVVILGGAKNP